MPDQSIEIIGGLYELARAGNWTRVLAALAGERELAAACSRHRRPTSGWTFLHQAAFFGQEDAARALIRLGASTTSESKEGETPAAVAKRRGHRSLARLLEAAARTAHDGWEAPSKPALLPSSCAWSEGIERTATRRLRVAYGGGVVTIPAKATYYVDSFDRVLIGWHGTFDPPCGMDGDSMLDP